MLPLSLIKYYNNIACYLTDVTTFHGILVNRMFEILEERDHLYEDEKVWVINEAMNAKKLQHGGTFRNVLSRKIDEVVIPILAKIIATLDHNCNLDWIDPKKHELSISQFWLSIFNERQLMQFSYAEIATPKERVPEVEGRKVKETFRCKLPFSWLIFETINSHWDSAKSSVGKYIFLVKLSH